MSEPEHPAPAENSAATGAPTVPQPPDRFAEQRSALAAIPQRPLAEHADVFAEVHARLQAALAEIDGL